jgi:aspartate/methionine/tyrosine aminotransferase
MSADPVDLANELQYVAPERISRLRLPEYAPLIGESVGEAERAFETLTKQPGLLNLTYADTHRFPPPEWALEAITHAAGGHGPTYTPYRGDPDVLEQVATSVAAFMGVQVDPERQLIVTPGTQAGLFTALTALLNDGDRVALIDPDYLSTERLIRFGGGFADRVALRHGGDGAFADPDELAAQIGPRTRCIVFSNPNNPTGAVYSRDAIEAIAEVVRERNLFVIADELYSRLVYDNREFVHIASLEGMADRTITLLGPSKTESLSGFRIGVAQAPADVINAMEDVLGSTVLRAPAYAQWALVPWLRDDHDFVAQRIGEYEVLRDRTVAAFADLEFATLESPAGTAYAFPSVAELQLPDQEIAAALARDAGVIINPGFQFGHKGLGAFRICFAQEEAIWDEALQRIIATLRTLNARGRTGS